MVLTNAEKCRRYYKKHKKECLQKNREYHQKHRNEILTRQHKRLDLHREENKENCKRYYEEHKEELKQKNRERHQKNREKNIEKMRGYYAKNRDKLLAQMTEYRKENEDELNEYDRQRWKNNPERRAYNKTESGRLRDKKNKSKRKRNLGFILLFPNNIDEPIDMHHINDKDVVAIPEELHNLYRGKNHRQNLIPIVSQLYPDFNGGN